MKKSNISTEAQITRYLYRTGHEQGSAPTSRPSGQSLVVAPFLGQAITAWHIAFR
jgi:hypothetical protein